MSYKQKGERLTYTNSGSTALSAGALVAMGDIVAVLLVDLAAAASGAAYVAGVHTVSKTAGQAWTQGAQLYLDAATSALTTTAGANNKAGVAAAAAASDATTGDVLLNVNA